MSGAETYHAKSGAEAQAAGRIFKAVVEALNGACGGRLHFGEAAVAAGTKENMPCGLAGPFAVAMCEAPGAAAGQFAWVVDVAAASELVALALACASGGHGGQTPRANGREKIESGTVEQLNEFARSPDQLSTAQLSGAERPAPDEMGVFKNLASRVCSAAGAALGGANASLKSVQLAASAGELLGMFRGECAFIAATGRIADMEKTILLACSAELCAATAPCASEKPAGHPAATNLERILKIPVPVIVVLAEKTLPFKDIVELTEGQVIQFDKNGAEPLALLVNDRKVGLGRIIKVGERFALRIEEIGGPEDIVNKLH